MADEKPTSMNLLDRVDPQGSKSLVPLMKAFFVGEDSGDQSNALRDQDVQNGIFKQAGAIPPIYDPNILALIFENSSSLRSNVDAYVTNIDSFGHTFEEVVDLNSEGAKEKIRDALRAERVHARRTGSAAKDTDSLLLPTEPTDAEVAARFDKLKIEMRAERVYLESFFENCTVDMPFSGPEGLRGLTRQDIEVLGYGYWEVLRNSLGEISVFNRLEARSIRLMPIDQNNTEVEISKKISLLASDTIKARKRFRRYVQIWESHEAVGNYSVTDSRIDNEHIVYFKEFGDPRTLDSKTGKYWDTRAEAEAQATQDGKKFVPATEIMVFKISSTRTSYGVPRWIGTLLAVLGTRQAEEVNFLYFENRSIPPMAILVSGGRMNANTVARLEDYIANQIRGKRNFHKIMILEAEGQTGDANTGRMKITLQPLTDAQQKDALFQQYDERNADKVGQAFRLPRILRGDIRDFNRSTAEAALDFAEVQVFGPQRQQFDWMMNQLVLPALGARYHRFKSNAPTVRDPQAMAEMIKDLVVAGVLTPAEARDLAEGVFNRTFEKLTADWTAQPLALTLAGRTGNTDPSDRDLAVPGQNGGSGSGGGGGASGGSGGGLSEFNRNGGMSAGGAGATQEALGVDQTKKRNVARALTKIHTELLKAERATFFDSKAETIVIPADLFFSVFTPNGTVVKTGG